MSPHEVWFGDGLSAKLARMALTPASWLYAGGWQAYRAIYRYGFKRASEPHSPIVVVGNLTVGGSGKSPLTLAIAQNLLDLDRSVVVSASGYGSPRAQAASLAPAGPLNAAEWGDEPAMIRWLMPELPLVVGRRRVLAAQIAHDNYPDAIMLMDDGFQHLPLKKHLSILLDEPNPMNGKCLPAGPYREPRSNRHLADLVIPGEFSVSRESIKLIDPQSGLEETPRKFDVLCALGRPERFLADLNHDFLGSVNQVTLKPDHDCLQEGNLWADFGSEIPIVVTAKDWVKLRDRKDIESRSWLVARSSVLVTPQPAFTHWLTTKLNGIS